MLLANFLIIFVIRLYFVLKKDLTLLEMMMIMIIIIFFLILFLYINYQFCTQIYILINPESEEYMLLVIDPENNAINYFWNLILSYEYIMRVFIYLIFFY